MALFLSLTGLGSWWEEAWLAASHAQGPPFWKPEVAAACATWKPPLCPRFPPISISEPRLGVPGTHSGSLLTWASLCPFLSCTQEGVELDSFEVPAVLDICSFLTPYCPPRVTNSSWWPGDPSGGLGVAEHLEPGLTPSPALCLAELVAQELGAGRALEKASSPCGPLNAAERTPAPQIAA